VTISFSLSLVSIGISGSFLARVIFLAGVTCWLGIAAAGRLGVAGAITFILLRVTRYNTKQELLICNG
jgi:hypothetical protein